MSVGLDVKLRTVTSVMKVEVFVSEVKGEYVNQSGVNEKNHCSGLGP